MAVTQIRGGTQIMSATITGDRLVNNTITATQIANLTIADAQISTTAAIATSKLADGANFLKRDGTVVVTANLPMGNFKITGLGTPTADTDAATKGYVDSARQGLTVKDPVRAVATGNLTLSGTQTVDGVALVAGDRILCAGQTTASANGIYVVAAGAWSRSTDADLTAEVGPGMYCFVSEGTSYADSGWVLTTNAPITLGTTSLTFVQFSGAGQITAGNGITKTGNTLSVDIDGTTLSLSASGVKVAALGVTNAEIATAAGIVDTKLATISTAGKVANSATTATTALTANAIVARDASGNCTAQLSAVALETSTNSAFYPTFVSATSGTGLGQKAATGFSYNPYTSTLTTGKFAGDGSLLTALNGTQITTGSVAGARLDKLYGTHIRRKFEMGGECSATGVVLADRTTFTIAETFVADTEMIFLNGVLLEKTDDYTIAGSTLTTTFTVKAGDRVTYTLVEA